MVEIKIELNMDVESIFKVLEDKVRQSYVKAKDDIDRTDSNAAAVETEAMGDIAYFAERVQKLAYEARRNIVDAAREKGYTDKTAAVLRHEGSLSALVAAGGLGRVRTKASARCIRILTRASRTALGA